jgi:arginase
MTDDGAAGGWDLIVTPWHLDEYIPAFPVPDGAAETVRPSLPAGPAASDYHARPLLEEFGTE